ncbi:hypothetical protein J7E96_36005 [Streptomyces sp. ISL-96]|uniref:hypothetical protein n=1 Tax=Streptomyces sp. ISL-96 TaxID=2819191 RepID=UPI001BE7BFA1|nr:hypothetical protein [Streptomyces sp. ISL-96]MBT2493808.1 hypothetical protein [Streptomyces sp. ISL-96]
MLCTLDHADVLMRYGEIAAVGRRLAVPSGARVVVVSGRMFQAGVTTGVDGVHPIPYETSERSVGALDDRGLRFAYAMMHRLMRLPAPHGRGVTRKSP